MNVILFVLAAWGMTQIIVYGEIFDRIRPKHKFFHCPMCIGFHVGWFLFIFFCASGMFDQNTHLPAEMFVYACISSATSSMLVSVFTDNGISIDMGKNIVVEHEEMSNDELHEEWDGLQPDPR